MIISFDDDLEIHISPAIKKEYHQKGGRTHSESSFLYKVLRERWNRIKGTRSCLKACLNSEHIRISRCGHVLDGLAGVGFSGRLLEKYLHPKTLHLNDLDSGCARVLKDNFPSSRVTNQNLLRLQGEEGDVLLLEFNTFTLKRWLKHEPFFQLGKNFQNIGLMDVAIYGYRISQLGFQKAYGVRTFEEYIIMLANVLKKFDGWKFSVGCIGPESSYLFFNRDAQRGNIVPYLPIPLSKRYGTLGLE